MDSGIGLFDFLVEAELQHYYNPIRNDLKILKTSQLKYVTDEDLVQLGMSRPEQRRLKKYYNKYFSPNYLSKIKKFLGPGKKDDIQPGLTSLTEESFYAVQAETSQEPVIRMPNKHVIPTENITVNKELGVGEFGVVQQGVWTNDGLRIQVAVKCLSQDKMNTNCMEFLKEASIMHSIDHKSIVRFYGVVLRTDSLMLVTELAPLRSLLECLKEVSLRSSFPVPTLCDFALQICDGMAYLENKRLIHRDLAARNILVFSKNKVKISDFGLSRALGVGKNYYQTNISVNLKLPIAWCAPECISFLKFTSASDVWAFAVTLWEMFSYGFQPWAGFSGYQVFIAIDSPNFQRLEQPECCPQQYYQLMLKCWSHDPNKRPKFSELINLLPDCKPEQVQAINPSESDSNVKRDQLVYKVGDVITILDKEHSLSSQWKGILSNGQTGYFNPSNVVALDPNSPPLTAKQTSSVANTFTRASTHEASGSGISLRNSLLRSQSRFPSKRRLCANMISGPQGEVKHTGHVGLDGVNFGDFPSFEHTMIPKQIVTPYKPSDDLEQTPLIHPNSPSHLTGNNSTNPPTKISDFNNLASDRDNNKHGAGPTSSHFNLNFDNLSKSKWTGHKTNSTNNNSSKGQHDTPTEVDSEKELEQPHEYQEIDGQKTSDFGQSLMEELDSIYNSHVRSSASSSSTQDHEGANHRNEITELCSRMNNNSTLSKKKQTVVKPLSTQDQIMLDSAIALYNVLSNKSMTDLEHNEQPTTPTTPSEKENKFFRLPIGEHSGHHNQNHKTSHTATLPEKRTFSQEVQSVPDIQSTLTEESRLAYESLVEQPVRLATTLIGIREKQGKHHLGSEKSLLRYDTVDAPHTRNSCEQLTTKMEPLKSESQNPLPLPPRDRTISQTPRKRHTRIHPLIIQGTNLKRTMNRINAEISNDNTVLTTVQNAQQYLSSENKIPQTSTTEEKCERKYNTKAVEPLHYQNIGEKISYKSEDFFDTASLKFEAQIESNLIASEDCCDGADFDSETKRENTDINMHSSDSNKNKKHLNLNNIANLDYIDGEVGAVSSKMESKENFKHLTKHTLPLPPIGDFSKLKINSDKLSCEASSLSDSTKDSGSSNSLDEIKVSPRETVKESMPKPKLRSKSVDDDEAYPEEPEKLGTNSPDRVSVEDLLKFADQKPCGRQRGTESDEVRIMCKVLNYQVSAETCLITLEFLSWNVHKAIKLARLRSSVGGELNECHAALNACSWDVSRAALLLMGHGDITQV